MPVLILCSCFVSASSPRLAMLRSDRHRQCRGHRPTVHRFSSSQLSQGKPMAATPCESSAPWKAGWAKPQCKALRQWFWRRSKLLEADAHGVPVRSSCALSHTAFGSVSHTNCDLSLNHKIFTSIDIFSPSTEKERCVLFTP